MDVVQLPESEQGSPDEWVLQTAVAQARTILTFDNDFGELVYYRGQLAPAAGIVFFRAKKFALTEPAIWLLRLIELPLQLRGFFTTVTPDLTRRRALPE